MVYRTNLKCDDDELHESEICGQTLGMSSTYQNKKTSSYKCGSTNASLQNCSIERAHLQEVLKMSSMRCNTYLGTYYHGLSNPFKDLKIVVDSLADVHIVLMKYPCIANS
jgi:hypothetical protein